MKLADANLYVLVRHKDGRVNLANREAVILTRVKQVEANALIAYFNQVLKLAEDEAKEQRVKANNQLNNAVATAEARARDAITRASSDADKLTKENNQLRSQVAQLRSKRT